MTPFVAMGCNPTDDGKRVIYWGRTGDRHTEWFPGVPAEPATTTP